MRVTHRVGPLCLLAIVVGAWFWPILLTGRQPSAPEITSTDLPLYHFYSGALAENRVPLWNERVGFGSPALADGRIGVCYPVHQVLYRLLSVERAYRWSLVLHVVLAGWFAYWCARVFGLGRTASILAASVFAGQGFFVIHVDQAWSYTTGCWLPLAVLATWRWLRDGAWCWLIGLSLVLGIQLLAGHFQIAGYTILTILLLSIAAIPLSPISRQTLAWRGLLVPVAVLGGLSLAAVQLLPTAELIFQGDSRGRGVEFLESFSSPPWHLLVQQLAPGLLQGHPLWEPICWIPWRSSRVESLGYVGLLPLGLGLTTLFWTGRRDRLVRLWGVVLLVSTALSLGGYLPGYRQLLSLPVVGWFAAPARWSVVAGLFWGLLAGWGLERVEPRLLGRWCIRFAGVSLVVLSVAVVALLIDARQSERFYKSPDAVLGAQLLDYGYTTQEMESGLVTPSHELKRMLVGGLWAPVGGLLLIGLVGLWPRLPRSRQVLLGGLVAVVLFDLTVCAWTIRRVRFGPEGVESPVLEALSQMPGSRFAGPVGLLPLVSGSRVVPDAGLPDPRFFWDEKNRAPAHWWAGRWPSLPEPSRFGDQVTLLSHSPDRIAEDDVVFMRLAGIGGLVYGANLKKPTEDGPLVRVRSFSDPWLTRHRVGRELLRQLPQNSEWSLWKLPAETTVSRAWFFEVDDPAEPGSDPRLLRQPPPAHRNMLRNAHPILPVRDQGETVTLSGNATRRGVLMLADRHYPGWSARLTQSGKTRDVEIQPAFGDWRAVEISEEGNFKVVFRYEPESVRLGAWISLGACVIWLAGFLLARVWLTLPSEPQDIEGGEEPSVD